MNFNSNPKKIISALFFIVVLSSFGFALIYNPTDTAGQDVSIGNLTLTGNISGNSSVSWSNNISIHSKDVKEPPVAPAVGYAISHFVSNFSTAVVDFFNIDGTNWLGSFNAQGYSLTNVTTVNTTNLQTDTIGDKSGNGVTWTASMNGGNKSLLNVSIFQATNISDGVMQCISGTCSGIVSLSTERIASNVSFMGKSITNVSIYSDIYLKNEHLIAYFPFDDLETGIIVHNQIRQRNNNGYNINMSTGIDVCYNNCSGFVSNGIYGRGLAFDGVDDSVNVPFYQMLNISNITQEVDISFWVNVTKTPNVVSMLVGRKQVANLRTYAVKLDTNRKIQFSYASGVNCNSLDDHTSTKSLDLNKFYFVDIKLNSTHTQIYIDGVLDSVETRAYPSLCVSSDRDLTFGHDSSVSSQNGFFQGILDEVRIYDVVLGSDITLSMYHLGLSIFNPIYDGSNECVLFNGTKTSVIQACIDNYRTSGSGVLKFKCGTYELDNDLNATYTNGLSIIGENRECVRINCKANDDGIAIGNTNNFLMKDITIDCAKNNARATVAGSNVTNATIQNNNILSGSITFALFFAGPTNANDATTGLTLLDSGNKLVNNYFYSSCDCDGFSWSFQKDWTVYGNTFVGSRVALFIGKDGQFENNNIYNSINQGIWITPPYDNSKIHLNNIKDTASSGILLSGNGAWNSTNLKVSYNDVISAKSIGISLKGFNFDISHNTVTNSSREGIWYYGNYSTISNNIVKNSDQGGFNTKGILLRTNSSSINGNIAYDDQVVHTQDYGVYLYYGTNNTFGNNNAFGNAVGQYYDGGFNNQWTGNFKLPDVSLANTTRISPNGTKFCCGVANDGTEQCKSGACSFI